jgi:NAD+ synthase (glutamine-hydrolysing)
MKIAIAQLNYHIGNFDGNIQKMLAAVQTAKNDGADLIVFGELSVCGYPTRDFLLYDHFIRLCLQSVEQLAQAATDIAIVVGSPCRNTNPHGKDLFNAAFFLAEGKIHHISHKALLPTYDVFDEYRYFEPAKEFKVVHYKGKKIALTICEDIWDVALTNPLYTISPLDQLAPQKPDFILNLSASPFNYTHAAKRIDIVRANALRYQIPLFYVNHAGAQTDLIFDGGSIVMSPSGHVFDELPYFQETIRTYQLSHVQAHNNLNNEQPKNKIALIHDALLTGIRDYFAKLNIKQAILGLSGGIDSAVVAVLAQRALGAANVRVLLMPSHYSSDHSIQDARKLAQTLNIQYDTLYIENIYQQFIQTLQNQFAATPAGITEENLQARTRGVLLMAMSNKFGNLLLNTSNKSEMAVGYGTLYGDMMGGLAVLGDLYKTEVYQLAEYINKDGEVIPANSIHKAPSAELRPNQKDQDSLPPYDQLDQVLFEYIENALGPNEIIAKGYDPDLVHRSLRLVNINEFKRHQAAPILRISPRSFGMGRRMPIVCKYLN